jgi:hypothetical protein
MLRYPVANAQGRENVIFPALRKLIRSAVDPTDINGVNGTVMRLVAPEPDTIDSDNVDPSTAGNPARDATGGRQGPAGSAAGYDDVRAIRRRHASVWLGRYVGLVIAGIAVGGALLLWFAVSDRSRSVHHSPKSIALFDGWHVIYDNQAPTLTVVIGAVGLALILAAGAALVERVVLDRSRRSIDADVKLLAPRPRSPRDQRPAHRQRAAPNMMHAPWFAALSMFVAINTVLYLTLAIIKMLPKPYLSDWVDQRSRRVESRSIYPEVDAGAHGTSIDRHLGFPTPPPDQRDRFPGGRGRNRVRPSSLSGTQPADRGRQPTAASEGRHLQMGPRD